MIIFAKICKSIVCKDFILQNVHPAANGYILHLGDTVFCRVVWDIKSQ